VSLSDDDWDWMRGTAKAAGLSVAEWMRQQASIQDAVSASGVDMDAWESWVLAMPSCAASQPAEWAAWKRCMPVCNDE
jgi:hypothetical protein